MAEPLCCAPETITVLSDGHLSSNIKQKVKIQPTKQKNPGDHTVPFT